MPQAQPEPHFGKLLLIAAAAGLILWTGAAATSQMMQDALAQPITQTADGR